MSNLASLGDIRNQPQIGKGGFGTVHRDPRNPGHCIKVLSAPLHGEQAQNLQRLVDIATWARPSEVEYFTTRFAWPIELFGTPDAIEGFTMPLAPASTSFDLTAAGRTSRQNLQLKYLMDGAYWEGRAITSSKPALGYQDRLEVAIDCLDSLELLHLHGLCYGDVSGNNIVARRDRQPGVFFFDADSIASVEAVSHKPIQTPDWETPPGLGPAETDRSRFALLVLRLLLELPRVYPDEATIARLPAGNGDVLGEQLVACYRNGSTDSFRRLSRLLREVRSDERDASALQFALDKGYARWMLREREEARSSHERRLIKMAEAQVELESEIDDSVGAQFRRLKRRNQLGTALFALDIRPRGDVIDRPKTTEQLRQLIYQSEFDKIASSLALEGLAGLETDPWLGRAVQHALIQVPQPILSVHPEFGRATVTVTWPATPYVNSGRLQVRTNIGDQSLTIVRNLNEAGTTRVLGAPRGAQGTVSLIVGVRSPSDLEVMGSTVLSQQFHIPPEPLPTRPNPANSAAPPARQIELFDPVEYAARLRQIHLDRRRRRVRQALTSVGVAAVVGVGAWFALQHWVFGDSRPPAFAELTVAQSGAIGEAWWDPESPKVDTVGVEGSWDGVTWNPVPVVSVDAVNAKLKFERSVEGEYPFLRLQRVQAGKPKGKPIQWPSSAATGMVTAPLLLETTDGVAADWQPSTTDQARTPTAYLVRYTINYPNVWFVLRTTTPRFRGSPLPSGATLHLQVQAVFADGSLGQPAFAKPLRSPNP